MDTVRAVGYVRVSTEEQAKEGLSVTDQQRRIAEYVASQDGWKLTDTYTDPGVSGSVPFAQRPKGALAFAADADVIVVTAWDRLGRDAADFLAVVRDRRVESISEAGEPPLLRDLRAVLAQEERRKTAERNRDAAQALFRQGRYNGPAPFGFRFEDGGLVAVEHEAEVVGRIFARFLAGRNLSQIARELNADGIATKRGGHWRQGTIGALIRNPVYIGRVRHGDDDRQGLHDGILDAPTFNAAQQLAGAISARKGGGRGRPPKLSHLFVGGALRCGACGESMVPRSGAAQGGRPHYLCAGRQNLGCTMPYVDREVIDSAVYRFFESVGLDVEATRQQLDCERDRKLAEMRALRGEAEREAQRAAERLARVRGHYQDGKLDPDDWREQREQLMSECAAAEAEAARLASSERAVERDEAAIATERDTLEWLAEIRRAVAGEINDLDGPAAVRTALLRLFDRFVLHPRDGARFRDEPGAPSQTPVLDTRDYSIEVWIRPEVLKGWESIGIPKLDREPLGHAENKQRQGVGYRLVEGPR